MDNKVRYWSGAHTKHLLRLHLVFMPKYRKRVLKGEVANKLKNLFYESAKMNDWWIHELEIMPDHVHMLLQIKPDKSLSKVVQQLKGGSSKVLRRDFPELEEFLWGDHFWGQGYFAESVGQVNEEVIRKYIRNQKQE